MFVLIICVFSCTKIVLHIQHYVKHYLLFQETIVIDCFKTYLNSMYYQIEDMFIVFYALLKNTVYILIALYFVYCLQYYLRFKGL